MRKFLFPFVICVAVLTNILIITGVETSNASINDIKLKIRGATAEDPTPIKACVYAGFPMGPGYSNYFVMNCYNSESKVCGKEYQCTQVVQQYLNCTEICCEF